MLTSSGRYSGHLVPVLLVSFAVGVYAEPPQETPAEYRQAVDEAAKLGGILFTRYHYARAAAEMLKAEDIEDPRIELPVLAAEAGMLLVRFIGSHDHRPGVLYEVRFDKDDRAELVRVDPPREPSFDELMAFEMKRAALAAMPMRCADRYVAVLGLSAGRDSPRDVYLVPLAEIEGEVPIGGFARVTVAADGRTALESEALSKTCLKMEKPDEEVGEPAFLAINNLLASTPLPTHVLTSLMHETALVVATGAGRWGVAGRDVVFLGPPPDEECCDEVLADAGIPRPPVGLPEGWGHAHESASEPAPWRQRLIVWRATDDPEAPWQDDERFQGQFPTNYPNDLPVIFPPDAGDHRFEMMWVRVFAYDTEHDRYLGHLLNQPKWLRGVAKGDRVVFGYDAVLKRGLARHDGGDYEILTLPPAALGGPLGDLYQGIRHYRSGEHGQVPKEIEACIETLSRVADERLDSLDSHDRYLTRYFLGRCLAEEYETDRAIEQFELALDIRPDALDPNMALLAEFLLQSHRQPASKKLEKRYLGQLELVRERYGDNDRVALILGMVFDRKHAGDLSGLSAAEIARRERVGFGLFRWKMP